MSLKTYSLGISYHIYANMQEMDGLKTALAQRASMGICMGMKRSSGATKAVQREHDNQRDIISALEAD